MKSGKYPVNTNPCDKILPNVKYSLTYLGVNTGIFSTLPSKWVPCKQFQNKGLSENSYSNSISGQESEQHVHTLEIGTKSVPPYSLKRDGSSLKVHPLVTDVIPYAVWSTEDVYRGMPCKNMTAEEAEFQDTFEWAKKALSEDADGASDNNNRMSISA